MSWSAASGMPASGTRDRQSALEESETNRSGEHDGRHGQADVQRPGHALPHCRLKPRKPMTAAIAKLRTQKRVVNAPDDLVGSLDLRCALRAALRSARSLAAGGNCGPLSMPFIWRW